MYGCIVTSVSLSTFPGKVKVNRNGGLTTYAACDTTIIPYYYFLPFDSSYFGSDLLTIWEVVVQKEIKSF